VLVIASDIRQLEHIEYTPAPDIIHEGAGHAPIIANPEYAEYLRRFGDRLQSNFFAQRLVYEAIRLLSIVKRPRIRHKLRLMLKKAVEDLKQHGRII
jgi:phenylalanine-4-hydroxylase